MLRGGGFQPRLMHATSINRRPMAKACVRHGPWTLLVLKKFPRAVGSSFLSARYFPDRSHSDPFESNLRFTDGIEVLDGDAD